MPRTGAVACGHPVTAAAAVDILEAGGNAFDAAIAAQFAACVAEPVLTSLAGGGFLLARPAGGAPRLFDFFAHTPGKRLGRADALVPMEADFGTAVQIFHVGPGSIATPGTVAGMFAAHAALGSLPMTELVVPAVRHARDGVAVNDFQGEIFRIVRPIYAGVPPFDTAIPGAVLRQPELAESLVALAQEGEGLFYRGELGQRLIALCRERGGHLSAADLAAYRVLEREPLSFRYGQATIHTNPPPSAGGVLIRHTLGMLGPQHHDERHVALALAATQRERERLLDEADRVSRGTTHISVVDDAGNLAAMTLSNGEGSGCLIPGSGIMTNNMLGEEDINPAGIGRWRPDTRLGSMMAPTLVAGPAGEMALGSGGSNRIRSAIVQVLVALLARGDPPLAAVARPRLHVEADLLSLEPDLDPALLEARDLPRAVQQWDAPNLFFGGVHLASRHPDGTFSAAGDPRRGGVGVVLGH